MIGSNGSEPRRHEVTKRFSSLKRRFLSCGLSLRGIPLRGSNFWIKPKCSIVHFAEVAPAVPAPASSSLAALLTGHILQDGEVILLVLKPSLWFMVLSTLRWLAAIGILLVAAKIYDDQLPGKNAVYLEAGIFVYAGRLMFAVLQWMSRLYVLTDMRILRLSGIFTHDLFDCPLRKVAGTRVSFTTRERILRLGSIDIVASDPDCGWSQWQTIARPREVHEQILAAIRKAKQGGISHGMG